MKRAGFMTYTAASHLEAIEMIWLPISGYVQHTEQMKQKKCTGEDYHTKDARASATSPIM